MSHVHHRKLPDHLALLCGRAPIDDFAFKSEKLQIVFGKTSETCGDGHPHLHTDSDEVYIVLEGAMRIEIDGATMIVQAGEFLCVRAGVVHQVIEMTAPAKWFVVRAPSVDDKLG